MPLFPSLYNFAHWLTQNRDEAEDLVQETYMKALKGFASFQQGTNFRAWMYRILRNTFLSEAERVVEEVGALTAIDGAVLLNRDLALVAFGVILPVRRTTTLALSMVSDGLPTKRVDLGSRGTRHRAGATYAAEHAGDVVFVASEDGGLFCIFRDASHERARLWRWGATDNG